MDRDVDVTRAAEPPAGWSADAASRLIDIIRDLAASRSLPEIQAIVRTAARSLAHADGASFILRDGDQCFYADEDAIAPLWKGRRFPMSACVSGWAMLHREPVVIEDIYADARVPHEAYRPTFVRSLLMVPVRTERPLGAIGVYWAARRQATPGDIRHLQALADSTAIAIENAALLEQLRAAKDAAESANRLKSEFLSVLSHELRTPMTPIVAWSEMLCRSQVTEAELREAAQAINACAELHLAQIDDLLDLAQLFAGSLRLQRAPVDVGAIVDAAVGAVAAAARAKGVTVIWARDRGPRLAHADERRLRQAIDKLLDNAVKFTSRGGHVRVTMGDDSDRVIVCVEDSGIGIDAAFLPHVFDAFRQADGSDARPSEGLGIGLALAREIISLHGGTITAASGGADQGAVFKIGLPRLSSRPS
jgi:two-component system CheB/CheR fusion protein